MWGLGGSSLTCWFGIQIQDLGLGLGDSGKGCEFRVRACGVDRFSTLGLIEMSEEVCAPQLAIEQV